MTYTPTVSSQSGLTIALQEIVAGYTDSIAVHDAIYQSFVAKVEADPQLRAHRDFVEMNKHGYGDRAFHYMWKLLVEQMPEEFRFLEIGVYKGQVLSLIRMLSNMLTRSSKIVGVTPLSPAGDRFSNHDNCDYVEAIRGIHQEFGLDMKQTEFVVGYSQDYGGIQSSAEFGPYDLVYIDGCHELEIVVIDLTYYPAMLKSGGFLVVDDASVYLQMPGYIGRGFSDVSVAAQQIIDGDPRFTQLFACGHNRVWQKTIPTQKSH